MAKWMHVFYGIFSFGFCMTEWNDGAIAYRHSLLTLFPCHNNRWGRDNFSDNVLLFSVFPVPTHLHISNSVYHIFRNMHTQARTYVTALVIPYDDVRYLVSDLERPMPHVLLLFHSFKNHIQSQTAMTQFLIIYLVLNDDYLFRLVYH